MRKDGEAMDTSGTPRFLERHFLPRELAALWGVSRSTVVEWAKQEPDLAPVPIGYRKGTAKRKGARLGMWRIPESIAARMYDRNFRCSTPKMFDPKWSRDEAAQRALDAARLRAHGVAPA